MKIQNVSDAAFKKYGKVITGLDCSDIIAAMAETPCPENVVYVPGAESLESCASAKDIAYTLYGGNPARFIKKRFDDELTALLLPLFCDGDLECVRAALKARLSSET